MQERLREQVRNGNRLLNQALSLGLTEDSPQVIELHGDIRGGEDELIAPGFVAYPSMKEITDDDEPEPEPGVYGSRKCSSGLKPYRTSFFDDTCRAIKAKTKALANVSLSRHVPSGD